MKTKNQAIHDMLWVEAANLVGDSNVFDFRPMEETEYPFIDFDESSSSYAGIKNGVAESARFIVNIWDTEYNRKSVVDKANTLFEYVRTVGEAYGHEVILQQSQSSINIMQDTTVKPFIWRAMITMNFL